MRSIVIAIVLIALMGCSRKWNNPVQYAEPLKTTTQILVPGNNAWFWNLQDTIRITWSQVGNATKYKLIISNRQDLEAPMLSVEVQTSTYLVAGLAPGKYYYCVKAWNPVGDWVVSNTQIFEKGPYWLSTKALPNYMMCAKKIMNNLYVSCDRYGLIVYDVSNANNITEIGYYTTGANAGGFAVRTNYIYSTWYSLGFRILDISGIIPTYVNEWNYYSPVNVILDSSYAYLSCGWSGLRVLDISNVNNITIKGTYDNNVFVRNATIRDTIAYIATTTGLNVLNIKDKNNIFRIATYDTINSVDNIIIYYPYAFLIYPGSIRIVNIADPLSVSYISTTTFNTPMKAQIYNGYLYVAWSPNSTNTVISIFNLIMPTPQLMTTYTIQTTTSRVWDIYIADGYVYLGVGPEIGNDDCDLMVFKTYGN